MGIYEYQRLVGKINDDTVLRNEFIKLFDMKDKNQMAKFGLQYAQHIFEIVGINPNGEINNGLDAVQEWIDGKTNYHKPRNLAFYIYKMAYAQDDLKMKKYYQTMAQIICIPHTKTHGLWATDFAITIINAMYPNNIAEAKKERHEQIKLLCQE